MSRQSANAALVQLHALFPQFDDGLLLAILQEKKNQVQDAADALIEMCADEKPRGHGLTFIKNSPVDDAVVYAPYPRALPARSRVGKHARRNRARNKNANTFVGSANAAAASNAQRKSNGKPNWVKLDLNPYEVLAATPKVEQQQTEDVDATIQISQLKPKFVSSAPIDIPKPSWAQIASVVAPSAPALADLDDVPAQIESTTPAPVQVASAPIEPKKQEPLLTQSSARDEEDVAIANDFVFMATKKEHDHPKVDAAYVVPVATLVNQAPEFKKPTSISVKILYGEEMRRVGLISGDKDAFMRLMQTVNHLVATTSSDNLPRYPKYKDEEGDLVAVHSQEELDECIRVHEDHIWTRADVIANLIRFTL